jgi:hypothetical protein
LRRPLALAEVLEMVRPICAALSYAHSEHVIHCDIKPANILVDQANRLYLSDFGIARLVESATVTFALAGTPLYMAPEQWRGEEVSPATDVYSLGVMLYELLTGRPPLRGDTVETKGSTREKIMQEHLAQAPPNPSEVNRDCPPALDGVVQRCLAKLPADRFQTAADLLAAIEAASASDTSAARAGPSPAGLADPSSARPAQATTPHFAPAAGPRTQRGLFVAGAGVVLTGLLVGAMAFLRGTPPGTLSTPTALVPSDTPHIVQVVVTVAEPATAVPVIVPTDVPSPIPSVTSPPVATPTPCFDDSDFVADVTVPDDTVFAAGTNFVKTWRFRNIGTCQWTPDYRLINVDGTDMNAPLAVPLGTTVSPGQEVDLSVTLKAPSVTGAYQGWWQIQNTRGQQFGAHPYVRIVVRGAAASVTTAPSSGGSNGGEPNLGTLRLTASWQGSRQLGGGQCALDFLLSATGGTGLYSYYRDKDVEDPNFKIVDRHPGSYRFSWTVPHGWGGAVGFIVWSGRQRPQRATASVWIESAQVNCP